MNIENKEQFKKQAAYMLTAYNNDYLGVSLNFTDLIQMFIDELFIQDERFFKDSKDLIFLYNEYLKQNYDYLYYYELDEHSFNDVLNSSKAWDLWDIFEGSSIDFTDDYFTFNVKGFIETLTTTKIIQEALENKEFMTILLKNTNILNEYYNLTTKDLKEIIAKAKDLIKQGY